VKHPIVVYNEAINMIRDEIFDLRVENEALKGKLGEANEKWLSESKTRIKLSYDNAKKNLFILERMKRQTQKLKAI
jgi:hypothetical protein